MTDLAPVVLLIFNRPRTTARVLEAVRRARPRQLLIVADGPRADRPEDAARCHEARQVCGRIDWPCDVLTHYSDMNMGCKQRILTGLDWAFSQVNRAIILEDDCLPEPSFFPYCTELLERYATDERVHMIRGGNFFREPLNGAASYHFSRWYHIWGWASWARAWQWTDKRMSLWPSLRNSGWLEQRLPLDEMVERARSIFDEAYAGRVDTWEYHFAFMGLARDALAICPSRNMVTNIGFGPDAAHYTVTDHPHARLPTAPMLFPLKHPDEVRVDGSLDLREWQSLASHRNRRSLWARLITRLSRARRLRA